MAAEEYSPSADMAVPARDLARIVNRSLWRTLTPACRAELRRQYRRDRLGSWVGSDPVPALVKSELDARAHSEALRNGMSFALGHCVHFGEVQA